MDEKQFAARLTELRIQKNVSARAMSLDIGQNQAYINNLENARNFPEMQSFFFICEYLGITPAEFFDSDNKSPEELRELTDNLKKLDKEQLSHVTAIVKAFIKSNEFPVRYMD